MTMDRIVLFLALVCIFQVNAEWEVDIEHSFNGEQYSPRAKVSLHRERLSNDSAYSAHVSWQTDLTDSEWNSLLSASENDHLYFVRTTISGTDKNVVFSSTDPCLLVRSSLTDVVTLSIDSSKNIIRSIVIQPFIVPPVQKCSALDATPLSPYKFNTTIRVIDVVQGPSPDTTTYLQKMEKEKQEKQSGDSPDNRSFIQKYWMYIVPVLIFFMLSSAVNPEAPQAPR